MEPCPRLICCTCLNPRISDNSKSGEQRYVQAQQIETPFSLGVPCRQPVLLCARPAYGFSGDIISSSVGIFLATALILLLIGTMFVAVHHAEVIARRTGEPDGTLVLTVAVTVIEVALIASIMVGGESGPALARDTVFSVIMIVGNELVGLCILLGGMRYREQGFRVTGVSAYLVILIVLATLTLVLPNDTQARLGPFYSPSQLVFVTLITLALYGVFLYIQTVRDRDYLLVLDAEGRNVSSDLPQNRAVIVSAALLALSLSAVILLSKMFAAVVEAGTTLVGAPEAVVAVVVACWSVAGERSGGSSGAGKSAAEEPRSGAGIAACHHQPDYSCGCGGQPHPPEGPRAGARWRGHRPAHAHGCCEPSHLRHRADQHTLQLRPSRDLCDVPVPRIRPLGNTSLEIIARLASARVTGFPRLHTPVGH
jgi:Ca2+/H+ antiporter